MMPLTVSRDCFPAPTKCYNCERKGTESVRKDSEPMVEFKRCGNCHLLTYCDKDCQREHWIRVHKNHCRFLSGKVHVTNSNHNADTCAQCIEEVQASPNQIRSENSPKTSCIAEDVAIEMKKVIGNVFGFHKEGKKCDCSLEFGLNLPFALGEMSGKYVEIDSIGLDAMLAHSLKIINAMYIKTGNDEKKNVLCQLNMKILNERSFHWIDLLISAKPMVRHKKSLYDQVENLKNHYDASNRWWKSLKFSVDFIVNTNSLLMSTFEDSRSLEDPKFQLAKQYHDYKKSQLQNQATVCEKQVWVNFMLWPEIVNGSLAILLPPGTSCHSCNAELFGEVAISPQELSYNTLSRILPLVSQTGSIKASCSIAQNPNCVENCLSKDELSRMKSDEDQWNEFKRENELFFIESRYCDFCIKASLFSHRCSTCLTVQYCSTACQKEDQEFHSSVCASWAKDRSRVILGKSKQKKNNRCILSALE